MRFVLALVVAIAAMYTAAPIEAADHMVWSTITSDSWDCDKGGPDSGGMVSPVIPGETIYLRSRPQTLPTVTITQAGGTATVTYTAHGLVAGETFRISGANQSAYNGIATVAAVTGANTFTYTEAGGVAIPGGTASPATGTIRIERRFPRTARFWTQDCKGLEDQRIRIANHPDDLFPVVFTQTANLGLASIRYLRNDWVTLDGTEDFDTKPAGAFCGVDADMQKDDQGCGIQIIASAAHKPVMYISWGEFETNEALRQDSLDCTNNSGEDGNSTDSDGCYPGAIGFEMGGVLIDGAASLPGGTTDGAPYAGSETGRVGVYVHTASATSPGITQYPQAWRERFKLGFGPGEGNVLRNLFGEALYMGNNSGHECTSGGVDDLCPRIRDIEVQYNWAHDTGRDGFNGKLWVEGDNSIHHNILEDIGFRLEDWELPCIAMANSKVDIHENILIRCKGQAINENGKADADGGSNDYDAFEPFVTNVWGNLVWDAGKADTIYEPCDLADQLAGIPSCQGNLSPQKINHASAYTPGPVEEASIRLLQNGDTPGRGFVWMNTVIHSDGYCIAFDNVDTPVARNNLCTDDATDPSHDANPTLVNLINNVGANGTSYISDNLLTTTALAKLVNPTDSVLDFRLQETSPAIDAANDAAITAFDPDFTAILDLDFDGNARPQGDEYDIGAFEFIAPEAPIITPLRRFRGITQ
jgi:hypothetical protein